MNAKRQLLLLVNGLKALAVDGILVYSTCALSECENDQLVSKAILNYQKYLSKSATENNLNIEIVEKKYSFGEKTDLGWIVLPDTSNYGPLYLCVMKKVQNSNCSNQSSEEET